MTNFITDKYNINNHKEKIKEQLYEHIKQLIETYNFDEFEKVRIKIGITRINPYK